MNHVTVNWWVALLACTLIGLICFAGGRSLGFANGVERGFERAVLCVLAVRVPTLAELQIIHMLEAEHGKRISLRYPHDRIELDEPGTMTHAQRIGAVARSMGGRPTYAEVEAELHRRTANAQDVTCSQCGNVSRSIPCPQCGNTTAMTPMVRS